MNFHKVPSADPLADITDDDLRRTNDSELPLVGVHQEPPFARFWYDDYDWEEFHAPGQVTIRLSQGFFAFIGEEDADLLEERKVSAHIDYDPRTGEIIKVRGRLKHEGRMVLLHRFLTKAGPGVIVEHVNHVPLDCRRIKNLWNTSSSENNSNTLRERVANPGLLRGVEPFGNRYCGAIQFAGTKYRSPPFSNPEEAHKWYLAQYKEKYGRDQNAKRPDPTLPVFPPRKVGLKRSKMPARIFDLEATF
ncbi:MAG TPA: hypothetical protein VIY48_22510 [Candidatus Paceibacterota bacterium]